MSHADFAFLAHSPLSTSLHRRVHVCTRRLSQLNVSTRVRASLLRDLTVGPESPGVPRKLTQVMIFSTGTGLLWYGYYKWCIEEELRMQGLGRGAVFALGPFTALLIAAVIAPMDLAPAFGTGALAWIMGVQYSLYRRINMLYTQSNLPTPMQPHWVIIPGFNLVAGLRSLHFLAAHWARERGLSDHDPIASRFPFLKAPTLNAAELLLTPRLWIRLGAIESDAS